MVLKYIPSASTTSTSGRIKSSTSPSENDCAKRTAELILREQKCTQRETQIKAREAELHDLEMRLQSKEKELDAKTQELQGERVLIKFQLKVFKLNHNCNENWLP